MTENLPQDRRRQLFWPMLMLMMALPLVMPSNRLMRGVVFERTLGAQWSRHAIAMALFTRPSERLAPWEEGVCQVLNAALTRGANDKTWALANGSSWLRRNLPTLSDPAIGDVERYLEGLSATMCRQALDEAASARRTAPPMEYLSERDRETFRAGLWRLRVALSGMVFLVVALLSGRISAPVIGLGLGVGMGFAGVIPHEEVASHYWSEPVWFIFGSFMAAVAFIKTGLDRRLCLMLFQRLRSSGVGTVSFALVAVTAGLATFLSDHAVAAIFYPIALILYRGSIEDPEQDDPALGKLLLFSVAMGCNIGGFGTPSGGARNVIMLSCLSDMQGIEIGYLQWTIYALPLVLVMIPMVWLVLWTLFRPVQKDVGLALQRLQEDMAGVGPMTPAQRTALLIFAATVWLWLTEKSFYALGLYPVRIGIGVAAVAGGIAYMLAGVTEWRDCQEGIDWGILWLYGGAMLFGRVMDVTGAASFLGLSVMGVAHQAGFGSGLGLVVVSTLLTGLLTQFMADGPAAAAMGPVALSMAVADQPGTTMAPFMALATAAASSFAYCMVIGTPPNAIIYGSGFVKPRDFLRMGAPLFVLANVALLLLLTVYWGSLGFGGLPHFQ